MASSLASYDDDNRVPVPLNKNAKNISNITNIVTNQYLHLWWMLNPEIPFPSSVSKGGCGDWRNHSTNEANLGEVKAPERLLWLGVGRCPPYRAL
jgi:hypothetical protein